MHNINLNSQSFASLAESDMEIVRACIFKGKFRATKPKGKGDAPYVWRMAAFVISNNAKHWCMPMTADFDLADIWWNGCDPKLRREHTKHLDTVVDAIVNSVPKEGWYGVRRWARAMGV